jgi:hypothetical protein
MRKISPSLVVSTAAVVIASAGSATAATLITGKQIKDGTITSRDVRNRSLTGADIKPGSLSQSALRAGAISATALSGATVRDLTATPVTTQVATAEANQDPHQNGLPVTVEPMCPDGQVALSGGGGFVDYPGLGELQASEPIMDAQGKPVGWHLVMRQEGALSDPHSNEPKAIRAYVICSP